MRSVLVNGDTWNVRTVPPNHPSLVDRTGTLRSATTDPETMSINISSDLVPPMLDKVLLHEVAHAITMSYGLLPVLRAAVPRKSWIDVEEWAASLMENYSLEAVIIASESLGRPLCIRGKCM